MDISIIVPAYNEERRIGVTLEKSVAFLGGSSCNYELLVIDDEPSARDLIQRSLSNDGFEVVTAADGQEGLRLARQLRPSAITLDVILPGMDGWTVLKTLKADDELRDIPVVMVSMLSDRNMGYTLGATEYLTKPVDRDILLRTMDTIRPAN